MAMKLIMNEQKNLHEIEVEIRYSVLDDEVNELARYVKTQDSFIGGSDNNRKYRIRIYDIFYVESVDKKTFIYTKSDVYRSELPLYQLFNQLSKHDFIQVNRNCIVNMNVIDNIKSLFNSKLEATLTNGEKINISRTFIGHIKSAFLGKESKS